MYESRLTSLDMSAAWREQLDQKVIDRIDSRDMQFAPISQSERDASILEILDTFDGGPPVAGSHRRPSWQSGWQENFDQLKLSADQAALVPRYFGKYPLVRWRGEWIKALTPTLEYDMFGSMLDWLFATRIPYDSSSVHEFGCGTGHNLVRLREFLPHAALYGHDWADSSQKTIARWSELTGDQNFFAQQFDFLDATTFPTMSPGSFALTVASLEQVGTDFRPFVQHLLRQPVTGVLHIEPVAEVLDTSELLDNLSLRYFEKRGYLSGYLDYLRSLEEQGDLVVDEVKRSWVGSFYIDGYTVIRWSATRSMD